MWIIISVLLGFAAFAPAPVTYTLDGPYAWSLTNLAGTYGSPQADTFTSSTESMIKPWLAADYLRRTPQPPAYRLAELSRMIIDSDDGAAQDIYTIDGADASVARMIAICGLRHTTATHAWWSYTMMSAADATTLGVCLADGRAAGPHTPWLLAAMRAVTGDVTDQQATTGGGRWGIIDGLPPQLASVTAIKNGWTRHLDGWHVNCLAVGPGFSLAIMMRYPPGYTLDYGATACAAITRQLRHRYRVRFQ